MIRKQRLPNGLWLITESMPDVRSVSIGVWLRLGSRDEPRRLNGVSHFIEHLVFKGTTSKSAREIALAMDSIGGQMDAFTSKEYTCFYAKVLDTHVTEVVDLLADIVQRPSFDATELERERRVVLEEIRMVEDTPDDLIHDLWSELVYRNHALGWPIQGTEATVRAVSRRALLRYFHEVYRPQHMLIVAAGNLDHARLARQVRRSFGQLARAGAGSNGRHVPPRPRSGIVLRARRELEQVHLLLGIPALPRTMAQRYALFVLNSVLGGTISSRLFQRIREERGLAYSVYSAVHAFSDAGTLNVYAATSPTKAAEVLGLVMRELRDLAAQGPTEHEVEVAREHLKGSLMLGLESTSSRMSNLARQQIYFGRQLTLSETLAGLAAVTRRRTAALAGSLFGAGRASLAAVGRVRGLGLERQDLAL